MSRTRDDTKLQHACGSEKNAIEAAWTRRRTRHIGHELGCPSAWAADQSCSRVHRIHNAKAIGVIDKSFGFQAEGVKGEQTRADMSVI